MPSNQLELLRAALAGRYTVDREIERGGAVYGIRGSFLFKPLRSHPRFVALLKKMNLA